MPMLLDPHGASPVSLGRLGDGLRAAFKDATGRLPLTGLGVLQLDGADGAVLTYVDQIGTTAHRLRLKDVPDAMRPGTSTIGRLTAADESATSPGLVDARVLLVGMPARVRAAMPVRQAVTVPLPGLPHATLVAGLTTAGEPTRDQKAVLDSLASEISAVLNETESSAEEIARLRRLEAVERVMPALVPVLDIRQVFARLSDITREAIPHDVIVVAALSPDWSDVNTYARAGTEIPDRGGHPYPPIIVETFLYHILDDVRSQPVDPSAEGADAGIQSSIGLPIFIEGKPVAIVGFSSKEPAKYRRLDLAVGRRIADYLALAMSHHRLAEESHRAAALQERETNLKMLDGLLSTLAGVLDVREVFERVSDIAKQVLPHDLMGLPLYAKDGEHLIVHAVVGAEPTTRPIPLSAMYRRLLAEPWDHLIIDDILLDPDMRESLLVPTGVRSLLRVAIRVEQRLVGLLDFGRFTVGFYTPEHALVARRIADHVALALSHQRLSEESQRATTLAERTANLEVLDGLLSAVAGVLDIREVFERVSEIAKRVLPHDAMALPIVTDDREHIIRFATSGIPTEAIPRIQPIHDSIRPLLVEPWDVHIFDNIEQSVEGPLIQFARLGYRSMLRICVRLDGQMVGALVFFSRAIGAFSHADSLIGRRIADHIALLISHQRLADESRKAAALQERAANLDMLDGLLSTLTGVLDIREVFDRVSEIAQKVLPHDAVAIGELIDGGERVRMYASKGLGDMPMPYERDVPNRRLVTEPWDFELLDDIFEHPEHARSSAIPAGMHSILFVPIKVEGTLYGALTFYAKARGHFKRDDVLVAKRIADHIALALSHHRLAEESQRAAALQERAANLDALDGLLNAVAGVLDVRSVFARISEIGKTVMPHDAMTIAVPTGKPGIARLYAATGDLGHIAVPMEIPVRDRRLATEPWDFVLIDDVQSDPLYAGTPAMKAGMGSILTMPIRIGGELIGGVNFLSRTPRRFTRDDVPMARRITDHIGLALSHEQLAEEMRKSAELRSRQANIGLLDAFLASVTDTVDLKTVFERVADIAQKVLSFDAMAVPVLTADRAHVRFPLLRAPQGVAFPDVMEVSPHLRGEWEHDIVEDLQADPRQNATPLARLGFRATLRIAIRVEGQLHSGVGFYSFAPGVYQESDVAIGRRIAGRLAISLMREQGMAATKRADEATERASRLESRVQALTDELNARSGFHRVVGKSQTWRQALTQATQVASTDTTVLLLGESGTGKEVVARFIHRASTRKNGPFVALNCAALPEQLLESELFGYERGAFTGAMNARAGKIEQAAGGVLFLDEVGEMSPTVQAKFLRVLQEREFQRLGGSKTLKADARVIAATNRDPKAAMERGQFREDLYYRLSVFEISLPPLRDRRDDIVLLVETFMADLATNIGRPAGGLSEDAKDRLLSYHWPGNVRELRNAIERAVILAEGGLITSDHLPIAIGQAKPAPAVIVAAAGGGDGSATLPSGLSLDKLELDLLHKAMAQAKNNKSQAAKLLGVPRGQFYSLLKKHGLTDAKR